MIVVIGVPSWRPEPEPGPDGTAALVALAAAAEGARVELVGRVGDDPTGDRLLLELSRGGVGHAAVLRDPSRPTPIEPPPAEEEGSPVVPDAETPPAEPAATRPVLDAADLGLALRYLTDFGVLVVADPLPPDALAVAVDAAGWGTTRLVVVVDAGSGPPDGLPADATVLERPAHDEDGAFARLVGSYAAALDAGAEPVDAFRTVVERLGWEAPAEA